MTPRSRGAMAVAALGALTFVGVLTLAVLNGSFTRDPLLLPVDVLIVAGYLSVGAFVAIRDPSNPIGWLLMLFAIKRLRTDWVAD